MVEDNTPTVTARRRKPPPKVRLRLETAKRLMTLSAKAKIRKERREKEAGKADGVVTVTDDEAAPATKTQSVKSRKAKVKKATLKKPDVPKAKFRKRQIHKSWLPTHVFHAKRAHMTPPKEPLWRFAIPLSPTNKIYRVTHRASTMRGAVAWDTSYMSTIELEGAEKSIEGLLKALGVGLGDDKEGVWKSQGSKWRKGLRSLETWVYQREGWPTKCIGPATIIWNPVEIHPHDTTEPSSTASKPKAKRQVLIRISPAGFLQLWEEVVRLSKVQKPSVTVEDLRFEIGSIEITGPQATEALVGVLWLAKHRSEDRPASTVEDLWPNLASITNPSSLPQKAIVSIEVSDPRLRHPPRTVKLVHDSASFQKSVEIMAKWPLDESPTPAALFDRTMRLKASRSLPSQKSINRRKGAATPGQYPEPIPTDPHIPILMFNTRNSNSKQGSWTILLPWKCVLPVWTCLMYYPLSSGNNPQFAGLQEKRQLAFESGTPWYPGDYPGMKAGDEWEQSKSAKQKAEWDRKPKSRRIEYEKVDLGRGRKGEVGKGWVCDWEKLRELITDPEPVTVPDDDNGEAAQSKDNEAEKLKEKPSKPAFYHLCYSLACRALTDGSCSDQYAHALVTVRLTMVAQGVPKTCARIYRLPTNDPQLRQQWLSLQHPRHQRNSKTHHKTPAYGKPPPKASHADYQAYLAARILDYDENPLKPGSDRYPVVPDEADLIGFITTGNFNLSEGLGTGIGSIVLSRVQHKGQGVERAEQKLCIVRDAGQSIGRLAKWELA